MRESAIICILLIALCSQTHALLLSLSDGTLLHGEIVDYDQQKISLKLFAHGGTIAIPWRQIHYKQLPALQKRLGLAEKNFNREKIKGIIVYLKRGGTVTGKLIQKNRSKLLVKTRSGKLPIPRSNILKATRELVDITEVYTLGELYEQGQKKFALDSAEGHKKLGQFLLRIEDYEHAKKHLEQAREMNPKLAPQLAPLLQEANTQVVDMANKHTLQLYHTYRRTHRYQRAEQMLEKLAKSLTSESLQEYRRQLREHREEFLESEVAVLWMRKINRKIDSLSFDRKMPLQEVQQALLGDVEREVIAELANHFLLEEQQVRPYFDRRQGSNRRHSYGTGTFIAGPGKLKSNTRLPRGVSDDKLVTAEDWWKNATTTQRREWLRAYYIERRLQLVEEQAKTCPVCTSKGFQRIGRKVVACPSCHGLGIERIIVAK